MKNIIEVNNISKLYNNSTLALKNLSLSVPQGSVYGLLGRNGSGKSTLIKILMALLHPSKGSVNVFEQDPWSDHEGIKGRIGYIAEDQTIPLYLKISEAFSFFAECYQNWNQDLANSFIKKFKLDANKKIQHLSKGQQRQVGLIGAVSHHPELLILDEPGGGLDAVARRELLEVIIEMLHENEATVFFSSHHIHNVERVASHIGILHEGTLLLESSIDNLHENYCRVILPLNALTSEEAFRSLPECYSINKENNRLSAIFSTSLDQAKQITEKFLKNPDDFQGSVLNLEEAFIAFTEDVK